MALERQAILGKERTEEITRAAAVREQVPDRDLRRDLLVRIVRQDLSHRVVERQFAGLDQLERRRGGEHLVHGAVSELRLEGIRRAIVPIGQSHRFLPQHLAPPAHQHRARKLIQLGHLVDARSERRQRLGLGEPHQREIRRPRRVPKRRADHDWLRLINGDGRRRVADGADCAPAVGGAVVLHARPGGQPAVFRGRAVDLSRSGGKERRVTRSHVTLR